MSTPPGSSRCRSPLCGPGGVLMGAGDGGVDADVPGDQPLGVRLGLQAGEDALPGAVALPAAKQPIDGLPGPVAGGHIPPRRPGPGPPADPVDQLAFAPGGWPARLDALGQQRRQPGPLLVGEVSTSHAGSISRDTPTFETRPSTRYNGETAWCAFSARSAGSSSPAISLSIETSHQHAEAAKRANPLSLGLTLALPGFDAPLLSPLRNRRLASPHAFGPRLSAAGAPSTVWVGRVDTFAQLVGTHEPDCRVGSVDAGCRD